MSNEAAEVKVQMRGPGDNGWAELAPQPANDGSRFSFFKKRNVTAQTVVEALATVVFELTLRVNLVDFTFDKVSENQRGKETNLGVSAMAAANSIEAVKLGRENKATLARIEAALKK